MDPAAFGLSGRRRTPGLRREEVALRANISTTWYTWLEQGRGGPPSRRVLESLSSALMLTDVEREHLFMLAIGQPARPADRSGDGVSPRLQRLLDAMPIPATIKTAHWEILAWNRAARLVLGDYEAMPPDDRNVMRRMFLSPETRAAQTDWASVARYIVATFRADTTRLGMTDAADQLVAELSAASPEFAAYWADHDIASAGEGVKGLHNARVGELALEFSTFAVDGRPDLQLVTYNPATPDDFAKVQHLLSLA